MGKVRTQARLERKRNKVLQAYKDRGIEVPDNASDRDILRIGYDLFNKSLPARKIGIGSMHSRYSAILNWFRLAVPRKEKKERGDKVSEFYRSYEWRRLRYKILAEQGANCLACGRGRSHGVVIHVDHIKPLRLFWDLRLDPKNLQVLCEECNHGKGNWDQTDWRQG